MKLGADVAAVDSLSRAFNDQSHRLQGSLRTIDGMVVTVWWQGPDADRFRRAWNGELRANGDQAAEALALLARQLAAQADQQRRASDPDATTSSGVGLPVIGGQVTGQVSGMVGAEASWDHSVKIQDGNLKAGGSAEVVVGGQVTAGGSVTDGPV